MQLMPEDPLSKEVSDRICRHMNDDHSEAVIQYAKYYGGIGEAKHARMLSITPTQMQLDVDNKLVDIRFDHTLSDSEDAHKTLVQMLRSKNKNP